MPIDVAFFLTIICLIINIMLNTKYKKQGV